MKSVKRDRKVTVRFTLSEYEQLEKLFRKTISAQLSHYIRNVVLNKPVTVKYRNASLDSFMEEVIVLRQELHAIGNNINQAVKKLHTLHQIPEFRQWIHSYEHLQKQVAEKTNHMEQRITKMSDEWLRG